jgi:hypothetical protein
MFQRLFPYVPAPDPFLPKVDGHLKILPVHFWQKGVGHFFGVEIDVSFRWLEDLYFYCQKCQLFSFLGYAKSPLEEVKNEKYSD